MMNMAYKSIGHHPKGGYMTSEGYTLHNLSGLDLVIDIAGIYFPLRSLTYGIEHELIEEGQVGTHDPVALIESSHRYTGTFTYASFLVNGVNVFTHNDALALKKKLMKQSDEGSSKYFDIYIIEVQGPRTPTPDMLSFEQQIDMVMKNESRVGFVEALADCKVTKFNRDIPYKDTVISSVDFKYSFMLPTEGDE